MSGIQRFVALVLVAPPARAQLVEVLDKAADAQQLAKDDLTAFLVWGEFFLLVGALAAGAYLFKKGLSVLGVVATQYLAKLDTINEQSETHSSAREERLIQVVQSNEHVMERAVASIDRHVEGIGRFEALLDSINGRLTRT